MIYLRACLHRYLILLIPTLLVGFPYYYSSEDFSIQKFGLFLLLLFTLAISIILYRQIYKIKQFAPLKQFLLNSKIDLNTNQLNPLNLSIILALNLFVSLTLWLYLSVYGGFNFFILVLLIYLILVIGFYPKLRLFDKQLNNVIIILLTTILPSILVFQLTNTNLVINNYLDLISLSIIIFSLVLLKDIKNIFKDHQLEKKNITALFSTQKIKLILYIVSSIPYLLLILKVILTQSPFYLVPLFSLPLIINILLKTHKTVGNQINLPLNMYYIYIIYHSFLILISNVFTIKFMN